MDQAAAKGNIDGSYEMNAHLLVSWFFQNEEDESTHIIFFFFASIAVKNLIAGGADVNEKDCFSGYTPLHWAVDSKRIEIIKVRNSFCLTTAMNRISI